MGAKGAMGAIGAIGAGAAFARWIGRGFEMVNQSAVSGTRI